MKKALKKSRPVLRTEASRQARSRSAEKMRRVQVLAGYVVILLSVIFGFILSFKPEWLRTQGINPAIGFGLAIFAIARLYALRTELRRQEAEGEELAPAPRRGFALRGRAPGA